MNKPEIIELSPYDYEDITGANYVSWDEWERLEQIRPAGAELRPRITRPLFSWQDCARSLRDIETGELKATLAKKLLRRSNFVVNTLNLTAALIITAGTLIISRNIRDGLDNIPLPWSYEPESCQILGDSSSLSSIKDPETSNIAFEDVNLALFRKFRSLREMQLRDRYLQQGQIQPSRLYTTAEEAVRFYTSGGGTELVAYYLSRSTLSERQKSETLAQAYENYANSVGRKIKSDARDPYQVSHWIRDVQCSVHLADVLKQSAQSK